MRGHRQARLPGNVGAQMTLAVCPLSRPHVVMVSRATRGALQELPLKGGGSPALLGAEQTWAVSPPLSQQGFP